MADIQWLAQLLPLVPAVTLLLFLLLDRDDDDGPGGGKLIRCQVH